MSEHDRLSEATDALTDTLHDAELFFASRRKFVRASVKMGESQVCLSWERHGSDWRLVIGAKTIEEANRAGRVLAALHLDALLKQLEFNERELERDLAKAIETAEDFVRKHPAPEPSSTPTEKSR